MHTCISQPATPINPLSSPLRPRSPHLCCRAQGKFFEATVKEILPDEKTIVACFPEDAGFAEACFKIPYDKLVVAVG